MLGTNLGVMKGKVMKSSQSKLSIQHLPARRIQSDRLGLYCSCVQGFDFLSAAVVT